MSDNLDHQLLLTAGALDVGSSMLTSRLLHRGHRFNSWSQFGFSIPQVVWIHASNGHVELKGNILDLEQCCLGFKHPMTYIYSQNTTSYNAQKLICHCMLTVSSVQTKIP